MTLKVGTLGGTFSNKSTIIETVYDVTADTGAVATYVMTAAASEDLMVKLVGIKVNTAVTSTGAATISVGTSASGTAFVTTEGKATFALNALVTPEACSTGVEGFVKVASGATLDCAVGTEVAATGKLTFIWEVMKF